MVDGKIQIKESDPLTNVYLTPTVPVSCPPCTMQLHITKNIGLDFENDDDCLISFSGIEGPPDDEKTIKVKATTTPSSYSRVARIVFTTFQNSLPGSPWDGYKPAHCPVSPRLLPAGSAAGSSAGIVFTHGVLGFGVFRPAGATRCTDQGQIWHGGADHRSSMPNFTLIGSGVGVYGPQN